MFWWHYWNTRPFPEQCNSLEEVIDFGKIHKILGFNHESIRAYIFTKIFRQFQCTSFVETGTLYGQTAGYVNRLFKTPIFSSEINPTYQTISRANLLWTRKVSIFRGDSTDFLDEVCQQPAIGGNPMFYLDAHWYERIPLAEELRIIGGQCQRGVILIDDFCVPKQPDFRFDEYPALRIDMDVIDSSIKQIREDIRVYLPSYPPEKEPYGKATGFALVLMGQDEELPQEIFPFDLLAREV